jgi:hypothetical protein
MQLVFKYVVGKETFAVVVETQACINMVASVVSVIGLLASGDFRKMKENRCATYSKLLKLKRQFIFPSHGTRNRAKRDNFYRVGLDFIIKNNDYRTDGKPGRNPLQLQGSFGPLVKAIGSSSSSLQSL